MEQPTKVRKITIEVKDGETEVTIMTKVNKEILEAIKAERVVDEFIDFRQKELQKQNLMLERTAQSLLDRMTSPSIRYYGLDLVDQASATYKRVEDAMDKLSDAAWEADNMINARDALEPFLECATAKECYLAVAKKLVELVEKLKD